MDETLKKKVYLEGSRLKNAGYDNEIISARLEKQGVPDELIKQVIINLSVQQVIDRDKLARPFYNLAIVRIGVGVSLAISSAILIPEQIYIPIGFILGGIISAVSMRKKML